MSSVANPLSRPLHAVALLSGAAKVNVAALVLAAAGMLLQIAAGSTLYPSLSGPIVLLAAAVIVALGPGRWTRYVGLLIPLALALGLVVAAVMTGDFIEQLTNVSRVGLAFGSVLHVIGLAGAVASGIALMLAPRGRAGER